MLALALASCASPAAPGADADPVLDAGARPDGADAGRRRVPVDGPVALSLDAAASEDVPGAIAPIRVLFIGNSYTYVNDLPGTVRALGDATPGPAIEVDSVVEGGARLLNHWLGADARPRIAAGPWDVVVLQEQSLEPLTRIWLFEIYARDFADAVRDAGARTVWYATWARRAGDAIYLPGHAPSGGTITPDQMTQQLDYAYQRVANTNGGAVARAGLAWQLATRELPAVNLYQDDNSHPSAEGTLLTACVMYQSITGQVARVPDPAPFGIPLDRARALCDLAPRVRRDTDRIDGTIPRCGTSPLLTSCGPLCVDLNSDARNCGACGAVCDAPRSCVMGACNCPAAYGLDPTYTALSTLEPRCNGVDERAGPRCDAAVRRLCAAQGCSDGGFGVASSTGATLDATCLSGDPYDTTYCALQRWDPGCDGVIDREGPRCARAIDGYCRSKGEAGGFGPVAVSGDTVSVTCVPTARVVVASVPPVFVTIRVPECDPAVDPWGPACRRGLQSLCRSRGDAGGVGAFAVSEDGAMVDFACIRR